MSFDVYKQAVGNIFITQELCQLALEFTGCILITDMNKPRSRIAVISVIKF